MRNFAFARAFMGASVHTLVRANVAFGVRCVFAFARASLGTLFVSACAR